MTSLQEDSLFSLEVVVDKLTIPKVACKFPAIAFRLLDFPTLIIYHVEPELGDSIKCKIRSDPYYKLGNQIPELLDKDGNYSIKKGKSCLLKISPDMLLSHLSSTPLYVMIIDTFPEVPKLIANCTIPLDSVMDVLYEDVCKEGLTVPAVRGEKGVYKLFNLMGTQIGGLVLGIRMLSLGIGLIPHLPAASMMNLPKQIKSNDVVTVASKQEKDKIQEQVANIVLEDLESKKKSIEVHTENKSSKVSHFQIQTQTEQDILQTMATQTEKIKMQRRSRPKKQGLDIESTLCEKVIDDIVVTNTVCPPPMYFNSEVENNMVYGLHFFEKEDDKSDSQNTEDWSDDDTIRPEDWRSDSDTENENTFLKKELRAKMHSRNTQKKFMQRSDNSAYSLKNKIKTFPLLNALMSEIAALQVNEGDSIPQQQLHQQIHITAPPKFPPHKRVHSPIASSRAPTRNRSVSPGRERESVEKYLNRVSSPRHTAKELPTPKTPTKVLPEPKRPLKLHKCQGPPKGVPKSKSWIREVPPPMYVQKTKLAYGMTNTQRLRLEKSNPKLLKTLEKQEEERVEKWKEQRRHLEEQRTADGTLGSTGTARYDIDGHRIQDEIYQKFGNYQTHKKPVPTPRSHSQLGEAWVDVETAEVKPLEPHQDDKQFLHSQDDLSENEQQGEYYEYEESDEQSGDYNMYGMENTNHRPLPDPGFPNKFSNQENDDFGSNGVYSYDFESAKQTNRTDTESYNIENESFSKQSAPGRTVPVDAGEELGLRKMVDSYSDEESHESFKSAKSYENEKYEQQVAKKPETVKLHRKSDNKSKLNGPQISVATPAVTQIRNDFRGRIGESGATASVDSTAYISRSQVLSQQSYESNISHDSQGETRKNLQFGKPRPSPRPRRNTESVSSYNGEDNENVSPRSGLSQITPGIEYQDYESESFEEDSDYHIQEPQSVEQAKLAPEARFGYTWGY